MKLCGSYVVRGKNSVGREGSWGGSMGGNEVVRGYVMGCDEELREE